MSQYSKSFILTQVFGDTGYSHYKVLLTSPRNSSRWMVIYSSRIGASEGDEVIVDFDYVTDRWMNINNPQTGQWASIYEVSQVK